MKKLIFCCLLLLCCSSWSNKMSPPNVTLNFLNPLPDTVFFGETTRIQILMEYTNLGTNNTWILPNYMSMELAELPDDNCSSFGPNIQAYGTGICHMNAVITTNEFKNIEGPIIYRTKEKKNGKIGDFSFYSPYFNIKVIPHGLSMATTPVQQATATIPFSYDIKKDIYYFDENKLAGQNTIATMDQESINKLNVLGLHFSPEALSITGTPNQTGTFYFNVGATNTLSTAHYTRLAINIGINPKDKPVFKKDNNIPTATAGEKFSLDMMTLLETNKEFMVSNQIKFNIDPNQVSPKWLSINPEKPTLLEGMPDISDSGKEFKITLNATSNTGGRAVPLTITIPVALDPEQKPVMKYFEMKGIVGNRIYMDLSSLIIDPAHDPSLKININNITPQVDWLYVPSSNSLVLEGYIPYEALGQKYLITLQANTKTGGSSDPIMVPLQIIQDKELIPQFKQENPIMNLVYPGQPYFYDFVEHQDVFPEYDDIPYTIKFADGSKPPAWLKIENNKLIAELVPNTVNSDFDIDLVISNTPGGESTPVTLSLTVIDD